MLSLIAASFVALNASAKQLKETENELPDPLLVPYERPIGFSINLGGILSGTFEGRFHLGLVRNITLVAAPSFQLTPELPLPDPATDGKKLELFQFKRLHLGAGVRAHFYEYDSWDGWFVEGLGRGGMTWINKDDYVWSVIPSFMIGYGVVYDSGYSLSIGVGAEYEFLLVDEDKESDDLKKLKKLYWGVTKLPIMGEISIGWTW